MTTTLIPLSDAGSSFITENIVIICIVLLLACNISHFLNVIKFNWLPASGAQMILGFFMGIFLFGVSSRTEINFLNFHPNVFFYVFLPPIVYEAGYSMKHNVFFQNIGSICLIAFIGTFISTMTVGYGLFLLSEYHIIQPTLSLLNSLIFGSLISATDPIATLAVLGNDALKCDPALYSLIFGESVLNDAIAIVLFQTFVKFTTEENFSASLIVIAFLQFIYVFLGSIILGAIFALISSFILYKVNYTANPPIEVVIMFVTAYMCYMISDLLSLSGLMSLFTCGILHAHYAWFNISKVSRVITQNIFYTIAHVLEALLYVHLGACCFFSTRSSLGYEWNFSITVWSFILCLIGRGLNVFPLSALANLKRERSSLITWKMQFMMWFSGLRGAVAFALVSVLDAATFGVFVTSTMGIVVFTTLIMGGLTHFLLTLLDISDNNEPGQNDSSQSDSEEVEPNSIAYYWVWIDIHYFQPYFGGPNMTKITDYSADFFTNLNHDDDDMIHIQSSDDVSLPEGTDSENTNTEAV